MCNLSVAAKSILISGWVVTSLLEANLYYISDHSKD